MRDAASSEGCEEGDSSQATERWRETGQLGQDSGQAAGEVVAQEKPCVRRAKGP